MDLPKEWQTPEAQQALTDALNRAIRRAWATGDSGSLRGCTIEDLHRLPETAARFIPHGLPHGAELTRVAVLARKGDKLAAAEVRIALERSRGRHEPVARGIDWEVARKRGRPPQTRLSEVIARFVRDEVAAGVAPHDAQSAAAAIFQVIYTRAHAGDALGPHARSVKRVKSILRKPTDAKDPL